MNIVELIVVFVIVWWLIFLVTLPIGVARDREVRQGNEPGAPKAPRLMVKAAATSIAAVGIVGAIYWASSTGQFSLRGTFAP